MESLANAVYAKYISSKNYTYTVDFYMFVCACVL